MIGGYRIAQKGQDTRPGNRSNIRHIGGEINEEGRFLNISGIRVPGVYITIAAGNLIPDFVPGEDIRILALKHFRTYILGNRIQNLLRAGPDIAQVYRLTIFISAQRLGIEVNIHRTGQSIGHYQRR